MPELPDIEVFRRRVAAQGLDRLIAEVDLRDSERLRGASAEDLRAALTGYRFEAARRHGKVLFVKVSCGWQLVMHFGMTGFVAFYADPADEPGHARLVLRFADSGWLAFDDQRKLGWLELTDDIPSYLHSQGIGPDALILSRDDLHALLHGKRGQVKPALMDQERIAGIGNVYADEILFQAGVRPDHACNELSEDQIDAIHEALRSVLTQAVEAGADPANMPSSWLTPLRGAEEARCPRCGGALETAKVSGRTAWFCPNCQSWARR